ncbi:cytidylyltransferase domain-containing protein [Polynucleobacter bastaniensis]|uniref:cytidylyltransferase domain-containing protein n=1 Tax=Polynucleobacter bastaniensis TaxID=2081039 RepID=UPI001C0D8D46|nr:hypothetical protein [Polynucleobacter bastaniensis]MBU3597325.1 acylneuraminate cytidylyltransferase [Polynucleobacter bastaniensis]
MKKLVATLACRNQGTRLYGKPLQNLDIKNKLTILEHQINLIKTIPSIEDIVLGISEGSDNSCYYDYAKKNKIKYITGSEEDVLKRLILCLEEVGGTDAFRITTESPFICYEPIEEAWERHKNRELDFSYLDNVPDGCGFEIIALDTLKISHFNGQAKHRSELCSLYIREHKADFKTEYIDVPDSIRRLDIRLTVDYPEDLIVCRSVYQKFSNLAPKIPLQSIIEYLDLNPYLKDLVEPFIDEGLKTMNI